MPVRTDLSAISYAASAQVTVAATIAPATAVPMPATFLPRSVTDRPQALSFAADKLIAERLGKSATWAGESAGRRSTRRPIATAAPASAAPPWQ